MSIPIASLETKKTKNTTPSWGRMRSKNQPFAPPLGVVGPSPQNVPSSGRGDSKIGGEQNMTTNVKIEQNSVFEIDVESVELIVFELSFRFDVSFRFNRELSLQDRYKTHCRNTTWPDPNERCRNERSLTERGRAMTKGVLTRKLGRHPRKLGRRI